MRRPGNWPSATETDGGLQQRRNRSRCGRRSGPVISGHERTRADRRNASGLWSDVGDSRRHQDCVTRQLSRIRHGIVRTGGDWAELLPGYASSTMTDAVGDGEYTDGFLRVGWWHSGRHAAGPGQSELFVGGTIATVQRSSRPKLRRTLETDL